MNKSSSSGMSVISVLGIVFIVLKLCHVIDWSWWWVLAPFWGGVALCRLVMVAIVLFVAASGLIAALFSSRSRR